MSAKITSSQNPAAPERAKLIDDLLRGAVHREEHRVGHRLSRQEVEAQELQTFEPTILWRVPKRLH